MKAIPAVLLLSMNISIASAQDCSGGRYHQPIFSQVEVIEAVPFGSNTGVSGSPQTLLMDVYQPIGDQLTSRPAVVVAFGGSFVYGTRQDVAILCQEFAKRGYVAIAPDYRIGFFAPNVTGTLLAVMRATHDMKACVRFLRRSVAENGDPWHIDPDRIIIGGVSAGAIAALHATYLNDDSEMPTPLVPLTDQLGGVEGLSGNPGYSSAVAACFNMSGALGDTAWIHTGDVPLVSIHDSGDQVVPYLTEEILVFSQPTGVMASGSHDIHLRMENLGIDHCLLTYPTNEHVGYIISDLETSTEFVFNFTSNIVCGSEAYCGAQMVDVATIKGPAHFNVHPNPADQFAVVDLPGTGRISILDVNGKEVLSKAGSDPDRTIAVGQLPAGVYFIRSAEMPYHLERLVIVH